MEGSGKFLYFAFGSNLLRERINLMNPSAIVKTVAKLENYRLHFRGGGPKSGWKGAAATIEKSESHHVWGVVWEMDNEDLTSLDRQESVPDIYQPFQVTVTSREGETMNCRTYQMVKEHPCHETTPSPHYLDVILRGAHQNSLPEDYIRQLQAIRHNGNTLEVPVYQQVLQMLNGDVKPLTFVKS